MRFIYKDKFCIFVLFYYCFGMVLGNLVCLVLGVCVVFFGELFDFEIIFCIVEKEKCMGLYGVLIMFIVEFELFNFKSFDLLILRIGVMVGSICLEEFMWKVYSEFYMIEVVIGYG